jgi:redox-sensitive bicupin YhaK (pirin superfamily)
LFVSELDAGTTISFDVGTDRQAYLLCIEGKLKVNNEALEERDAIEIRGGGKLTLAAPQDSKAHLLMVEMKREL